MTTAELPASILTRSQKKKYGPRKCPSYGPNAQIIATVRYDDECGNGHNSFAITADIYDPTKRGNDREIAGGCCHEEIAEAFPELAPFIKWHLVSSDGPMHYPGNVTYHAGDRDHWGLRLGESRQIRRGGAGGPLCWDLHAMQPDGSTVPLYKVQNHAYTAEGEGLPTPPALVWVASCHVGEGKARELDSARHCAVWPEATDAELSLPKAELEALLLARLPALVTDFRRDVESLGFTY